MPALGARPQASLARLGRRPIDGATDQYVGVPLNLYQTVSLKLL